MRKFTLVLILTFPLGAVTLWGQKLQQPSLTPTANELSLASAANRVVQHLATLKRLDPGKTRYRMQLRKAIVLGQEVRVWDVRVDRQIMMYVDSGTGVLLMFSDLAKAVDRQLGRNRTGNMAIASQTQGKQHLLQIKGALGVPTAWNLGTITYKQEVNSGRVTAALRDAQGRMAGSIAVDIQDGKVYSFARKP